MFFDFLKKKDIVSNEEKNSNIPDEDVIKERMCKETLQKRDIIVNKFYKENENKCNEIFKKYEIGKTYSYLGKIVYVINTYKKYQDVTFKELDDLYEQYREFLNFQYRYCSKIYPAIVISWYDDSENTFKEKVLSDNISLLLI